MYKVFVDGFAGTTGLRIVDRLSLRNDIKILTLSEEDRKNIDARLEQIKNSDVTILCLPDSASLEICEKAKDIDTIIIDTSTANRCNENFTYGFPELTGYRAKIKNAKRIANPGCHASGFISLIAPLVENNLISKDERLTCFSLTGYTGGGKKMIAEYEQEEIGLLNAPRQYGLTQNHKHLKEMAKICNLTNMPAFSPIVANFSNGMEVTIPLFKEQVKGTLEDIKELYRNYYKDGLVYYKDMADENGFLSAMALEGKDTLEISCYGNVDRLILVSRFDNLGKGASGAAIQNMNIALGLKEDLGLVK